jgi:hypothetical protein
MEDGHITITAMDSRKKTKGVTGIAYTPTLHQSLWGAWLSKIAKGILHHPAGRQVWSTWRGTSRG